ncbi:RNA ligase family protein, partial [Acinetobacter baumannii]
IESKGEHEQYEQFKKWCLTNVEKLWEILESKYVLFGEWVYCQHAVTYDQLPDFFIAFDLLDKETETFLSYNFLKQKLE